MCYQFWRAGFSEEHCHFLNLNILCFHSLPKNSVPSTHLLQSELKSTCKVPGVPVCTYKQLVYIPCKTQTSMCEYYSLLPFLGALSVFQMNSNLEILPLCRILHPCLLKPIHNKQIKKPTQKVQHSNSGHNEWKTGSESF